MFFLWIVHPWKLEHLELKILLYGKMSMSIKRMECAWLKYSVNSWGKKVSGHWYLICVIFRIQDLVCTLKHSLCFLVMVYISTQGDCAPVHSVSWVSLALNFVHIMSNIKVAFFIGLLWIKISSELKSSLDSPVILSWLPNFVSVEKCIIFMLRYKLTFFLLHLMYQT